MKTLKKLFYAFVLSYLIYFVPAMYVYKETVSFLIIHPILIELLMFTPMFLASTELFAAVLRIFSDGKEKISKLILDAVTSCAALFYILLFVSLTRFKNDCIWIPTIVLAVLGIAKIIIYRTKPDFTVLKSPETWIYTAFLTVARLAVIHHDMEWIESITKRTDSVVVCFVYITVLTAGFALLIVPRIVKLVKSKRISENK